MKRRRGFRIVTIQLPEDLVIALRVRAVVEGRTVSSIVEDAVRAWLRQATPSNGHAGLTGLTGQAGQTSQAVQTGQTSQSSQSGLGGQSGLDLEENPWVSIIRARSARA